MTPSEFIDQLAPAARACHLATGIPASFTLVQAALESSWGRSDLAVKARNIFSVKADRSWTGPILWMNSAEFVKGKRIMLPAKWRVYDSWQACLDDRVAFFRRNPRYAHCFDQKTGEGWARAVQAAGYATDPNYADKLIAMINGRNLIRFDQSDSLP